MANISEKRLTVSSKDTCHINSNPKSFHLQIGFSEKYIKKDQRLGAFNGTFSDVLPWSIPVDAADPASPMKCEAPMLDANREAPI